MAMSSGTARGSITIGCMLLALALASVICGGVTMNKTNSFQTTNYTASMGLWALYFVIPGVLSIVSGCNKRPSMLGVALCTHILGIFIAIAGTSFAAAIWSFFNASCNFSWELLSNEICLCVFSYTGTTYFGNCSDLKTIRNANAAITIIFAFLTIVSFVGSIQGCMGTCCAPREPVAVVASQFQVQPNTMIVTSSQQQAHFMQPGQFAEPAPQPYNQPPPGYDQPGVVGYELGNVNQVTESKN